MFYLVFFCLFLFPSNGIIPSLFRTSELSLTNQNWVIERVRVLPIDHVQLQHSSQSLSYIIYRHNSLENSTSFILDLKLNKNFNRYIPIGYDNKDVGNDAKNCRFYTGTVRHWETSSSIVAVSICEVLTGLIHSMQDGIDYFLEPVLNETHQSYILSYQQKSSSTSNPIWSCEMSSKSRSSRMFNHSSRTRRSLIRERFIETLLVADSSVNEYFSHPHITELYLLTMMNMVNSIYAHDSLGYPVEIVLTQIIILSNESDFQMATKSHETLNKFCQWQEQLKKVKKQNQTVHHDVAVFLTRKSLCQENSSCSTIGLAHMAGMCVVNRSCNINQDLGLISAFTVAHEIGHNLGMSHDGEKGQCMPRSGSSNSDTIMVPSYSKVPVNVWSQCSRDNLTDFFDQGWAKCLNNRPNIIYPFDDILPGILFDLDEQCRLALGPQSKYCFLGDDPPIDVCNQLMCTKIHAGRNLCVPSMMNQPADGTLCAPNKWCLNGQCTPMNYRADTPPIHGGWSAWTPWSTCSHTCGLGVEYQQRTCTNPKPSFGGKQCLGVRKRYRTCTLASCKKSTINTKHHLNLNCEELNIKSNGTKWKTVPWFTTVPCMVFCTPITSTLLLSNDTIANSNTTLNGDEVGRVESIKLRDGTQCIIDEDENDDSIQHNGICIAGQCQKLGCDNQLYSTAIEDECGICNGHRKYCQQVTKTLQYKKKDSSNSNGPYIKIGSISKGIATFQIEKTTQSTSFLALKIKDFYYLNGNRSITEHHTFQIGQTRISYTRGKKQEIIDARRQPLNENIDIMLLILSNDLVNVKYNYWEIVNVTTVNKTKIISNSYQWTFENDTNDDCSCTIRQPQCTSKSRQSEIVVVSDQLCDSKLKPQPLKCSNKNCSLQLSSVPRWHIGPWKPCEGRCWPQEAIQRRNLLCVRTISNSIIHTIPTSICIRSHSDVPITIRQCPENASIEIPKCSTFMNYGRWNTSEWKGDCSLNPCAIQYRTIECISNDLNSICIADERLKPTARRSCNDSCGQWLISHWSKNCTGSCNNSTVTRKVWCSSTICDETKRPLSIRRCILPHCAKESIYTSTSLSTSTSTKSQLNTTKVSTSTKPITTTAKESTKKKVANTTKQNVPKTQTTSKKKKA